MVHERLAIVGVGASSPTRKDKHVVAYTEYRVGRAAAGERRRKGRPRSQWRDLQPQAGAERPEEPIPLQDALGLRSHNTSGETQIA